MLNEIQIIPQYKPICIRGAGAFGYVMEALDVNSGSRVAIKRTHKVGKKLSREFQVLDQLNNCENVVKMLSTFYTVNDDGRIVQNVVFEYVEKSLENLIQESKQERQFLNISEIKSIMFQIFSGLKYCHGKNIYHRDLKPENILYTKDKIVKICDFGSSKQILPGEKSTPYIVSRYYRSPELLLGCNNYNYSIDIFAVGCIMAELFTLTPLFAGKTEGLQIFEHICLLGKPEKKYFDKFQLSPDIKNFFLNFEEVRKYDLRTIINVNGLYSKQDIDLANDLIEKCLLWEWDSRITSAEALKHPFFNSLRDEI